jgi:lipid II:glycine glycyltransferase (peptidoglycan interpeptide bridge formation enzyme)
MEKSFLQSNQWLDFQKSFNWKVWRVGEIGVIRYNLPFRKSYLYSPYCESKFFSESFLEKVKEIAKQENSIFFKAEPLDSLGASLKDYGFVKAHNIQPQKTLILDILKSEQELLEKMHSKTRYNIQLAQRKGVKIQISRSRIQNFKDFWRLMEETTKRDGFRSHPKEYYRKLLEIYGVELFVAEHDGKIIAANIIVFYDKQAIYLHGASDYEHRNLMAAPLLQWEQIKEAKKRGCIEYDFWGIDEEKWPGVTRFKKSFNGKEIEYPGAYDLIFQPMWYGAYKIARKIL